MHLLELNYDVLSEIISSTQTSELSNFVRTCHLAHDLAMPYLLSSVHLHRDHQQVLNFCHFMLSDPPRWIPMLRVLRILRFRDGPCIDNNDSTSKTCNNDPQTPKHPVSLQVLIGTLLADVLKHACNLSCLRLDDIEQLLECAPQICGAIIFCPKLTTVHFSDMGQRSRDMMVNMLGLRHVDIHHHDGDVTTLLRPFQSTLEEVSCTSPHIDHQGIEFDEVYQWPRVHTLHLGNHTKNKIIKQKLVRAFPNLQTLLLVQRPTDLSTRALNEGSECWPRLDYVQGSLVDLYNLAFSCPIRELNVRGVVYSPNQQSNSSAEMFLDLVRATQPSALSFSVSEALLDTSFYEQFSRFVPRLAFLELSLIYGSATFLQQLDCVLHSLDAVPIVYLSLRLLFTSRSVDFSVSERMKVVDRISNSIPSIRYIELQWPEPNTIDIRRDSPPSHRLYWQVPSDKRELRRGQVEELPKEMGFRERPKWTSYPIRGTVDQALLTAL